MPIKWPTKYSKTTNRHNEWSTLKKKHEATIKASKIKFDGDLGAAVDSFENQIKKVAALDFGNTATLQDLEKVSDAGLSARKVASAYKTKISGLADPAKKELTGFLAEIEADALMWADATLNVATPNANWKAGDWNSCESLATHSEAVAKYSQQTAALLENNANIATSTQLQGLLKHLKDLNHASAAVTPIAKKIEGLVANAVGNVAYIGILKAEASRAVAGSILTLHQAIIALGAYIAGNLVAKMNFEDKNNIPSRILSENVKFLNDSVARVVAAEKSLKVK